MEGLAASVVLMAILLGVLLLVVFDGLCLVYLAAADRVSFLPKWAWAVVIVCVSPLGGLVYLLSRRHHRSDRLVGGRLGPMPPAARGT